MTEEIQVPTTPVESADLADKYDRMLRLADLFDSSGQEMRARSKLGAEILRDEGVAESSALSKATYDAAADDIRAATTGKHGLLTRSIELDADALVVRATVLTYRWIDELQEAAYKTLGTIAGRAIGYLAPGVALGGAIVSAGLIETDALDRDGIADYLNDLAEANPDLMDHVTSGGGGLVEAMQLRSLLTSGLLAGDRGRMAASGGLRAIGVDPFAGVTTAAVRDVAGPVVAAEPEPVEAAVIPGSPSAPRSLEELMTNLSQTAKVPCTGSATAASSPTCPVQTAPAIGRRPPAAARRRRPHVVRRPGRRRDRVRRGRHRRRHRDAGRLRLGGVAAAEIAAEAQDPRRSRSTRWSRPAPRRRRCRPCPRAPGCCRSRTAPTRSPCSARSSARARATGWWSSSTAGRSPRAATSRCTCGADGAADRADNADLRAEISRIQGLGYLARGEHQRPPSIAAREQRRRVPTQERVLPALSAPARRVGA